MRLSPLLLVLCALALRVAWVLLVPTKPVGDFAMYLESAVHLQAHGALDPEFVYMPGYVALAAAVYGLGGGLLAIKLVGAVAAGLAAGAVYGLGRAAWDHRAGLVAGWGYALWPAGIAVTSVTGTDMPAGVLIAAAAWVLARWGKTRPWAATLAFGAVMGLAAYVRAVAVPLAGFSLFYFLAAGAGWWRSLLRAGAAALIAFVALVPWGLRNQSRYGEWFITDSHGGLTALVGANPNSDGRYSRSLNLVFQRVTGYTLLAEPHREADRASYVLAKRWTAFSPAYAAGLVAVKAERLLAQERPLLYWPLYRAGVLPPGELRTAFERARAGLEVVVDGYWWTLAVAFFAGAGLAVARRRWVALAFLPVQLALVGVYALYFAEVRYHLPIAVLMFPVAAGALVAVAGWAAELWRARGEKGIPTLDGQEGEPDAAAAARTRRRALLWSAGGVLLLVVGWPVVLAAGEELRERHRFAAHTCLVEGQTRDCLWRKVGAGRSPIRGVHDGLGLWLDRQDAAGAVAAELSLELPAGRWRLHARLDVAPPPARPLDGSARFAVRAPSAGGKGAATETALSGLTAGAPASTAGRPATLTIDHPGGPLTLELRATAKAEGGNPAARSERVALWLADLVVEGEPGAGRR